MDEIADRVSRTLVEELESELGDVLRSVTTYDSQGYRDLFVREDVFNDYSIEEEYELYHEWILNSSSASIHEDSLLHAGEYRGQVRVFDQAITILVPLTETAGLFVAYDYLADVSPVRIIELCLDHLTEES